MAGGSSKKDKLSWTKSIVKKWLNIKSKAEDFHADNVVYGGSDGDWRNNFSQREACCSVKKSKTERSSRKSRTGRLDQDASQITDVNSYRVFVATWNVAGKSPPSHLNLEDWLHTSPPADIYVLGFQEIVPLNASNVLGTEDNGPAKKWLALIRRTLSSLPGGTRGGGYYTPSPIPDPIVESDADFEGSTTSQNASSYFHRRSFQSLSRSMRMDNDTSMMSQPRLDRRFSVCDRVMFNNRSAENDSSDDDGDDDNDECGPMESPNATNYNSPICYRQRGQSSYCLVASKQMVGVFLTVWVKSDLRDCVRNLKVSCVGRGLMGYLGNKGSISISMSLHQTSFCFVCSHLTSGQKEGDELRRNSDVMEILRKTRFPRVDGTGDEYSPRTILEHDRIIWLGDLNYRLRIEQRKGRIFTGWNEGKIYFPPTYKYSTNSDRYAGDAMNPKEKRRTPAWCDRILWYGRGMRQLSYVRGESRFSDHRPVYGVFLAEVESISRCKIKRMLESKWKSCCHFHKGCITIDFQMDTVEV
ncbi:hypothetical protein V2J09_022093 [Rumex salicifolius]